MQFGKVSGVTMSFDDAYLLIGAHDGSLYVLHNEFGGTAALNADPAPLPDVSSDPMPVADDITDPAYYSIEEAKQKAEHDALIEVRPSARAGRYLIARTQAVATHAAAHWPHCFGVKCCPRRTPLHEALLA